jgi:hypothetical protein
VRISEKTYNMRLESHHLLVFLVRLQRTHSSLRQKYAGDGVIETFGTHCTLIVRGAAVELDFLMQLNQ